MDEGSNPVLEGEARVDEDRDGVGEASGIKVRARFGVRQ